MKKGVLITIIGIVIIGITYFGIEMLDFAKGVKEDAQKSEIKLEQKPIIKLTEFRNGRWINKTDSFAEIEIKNGKWIMYNKSSKTDSSNVYDYKINREYFKELSTEHKPMEYLKLTNKLDTLDYSILKYNDEELSLINLETGNSSNYKPEN